MWYIAWRPGDPATPSYTDRWGSPSRTSCRQWFEFLLRLRTRSICSPAFMMKFTICDWSLSFNASTNGIQHCSILGKMYPNNSSLFMAINELVSFGQLFINCSYSVSVRTFFFFKLLNSPLNGSKYSSKEFMTLLKPVMNLLLRSRMLQHFHSKEKLDKPSGSS